MNIQEWLISIGAREVTYPASVGRQQQVVTWHPEKPWSGDDADQRGFFARYGHYNHGVPGDGSTIPEELWPLYSAGTDVGEAQASLLDSNLQGVLQGLTGNAALSVSKQDLMDLKLVKDPSASDVVYNTRIKPLLTPRATGGSVSVGSGGGAPAQPFPAAPQGASPSGVDVSALQQIVTSTLAAALPVLLQAELARLLPKAPPAGSSTSEMTGAPAPPASASAAAVMGPLAASATSILSDLNRQVGPSGGGHWAQLLRSLATGVQHAKDQLVS